MERLTDKKEADAQRREYENRMSNGYPRNIPEERFLKLAAYEDTGLGPEDIKKAFNEEAILKLAGQILNLEPDRIQELAQAEKDGRLVMLPCNIHQPIYIVKNGEIHQNYGCQWHFTDKECQTFGTLSMYGEFVRLDDFGKTVFLIREEAEAALKKREADNEAV